MVDQEIFSRRLAALRDYLNKLAAFRPLSEAEFIATPAYHDLAERYLHLAMEAVLDLANHAVASEGLRTPETNADVFTVLEEAGALPAPLAEQLRGWAGFRNVLVHQYLSIDHAVSYRAIQHELIDLEAFADWATDRLP